MDSMERKYANRPNWSRILEKEYKQTYLNDNIYRGHITFLTLRKVKEPLYVNYGDEDICIIDNGYIWMMHFPEGTDYSTTTTFDRRGKVIQWYFDIINSQGISSEGIPFIDDIYLDLVYLPNGRMSILDEDEFEEAFKNQEITKQEYDKAKQTLNDLIESIANNTNQIIRESKRHFELMKHV
jgi:predicted RNA-binding protein associated with RNAse of E/G family